MSTKRKPDSQVPAEESDLLLIRPLYVGVINKLKFDVDKIFIFYTV